MQGLRPIDSERKHISSFEWALMQDKMNPPLCRRSIAVRISFMFQFSLTLILFTLCKSESSANLLRGSEGNGFKPARRWQNTAEISMNHLSNMKRSMRHCICMSMRGYSRDKFTQGKSDREGTFAKCLAQTWPRIWADLHASDEKQRNPSKIRDSKLFSMVKSL